MRVNQEDTSAFNTYLKSGRFSNSHKILTGPVTITQNGSLVNFFDAGGSTRAVTLPPLEEGRFYVVNNIGVSGDLLVQSANALAVTTLHPGESAMIFASDAVWVPLHGGQSAIGIFTNLIDGLVPAPHSGTPGTLFLRDDGQWVTTGSGPVTPDAFKFMTDGVNTATGAGADTFRFRSSSGKVGVTVTDNQVTFGDNIDLTVNEASLSISAIGGYDPNKFFDHTLISVIAGIGLAGGGTIAANRTIDLDLNDLVTDTPVLADTFGFYDVSGGDTNKATFTVLNGILVHNSLSGYVANEHINHSSVSIVASTGLSGGGDLTTSRSLALDFNSLAADTLAAGDFFAFWDISGGDTNKVTLANLGASLTTVVGNGPGTSTPLMDGTATVGVSLLYARDDHRHPTDTSRAATSHSHVASDVTDFSEAVDDRVNALLVAGSNITLSYNDPANTLTITSTAAGGGGGDVVGPASAVSANIATFNGTTGKVIQDGGVALAALALLASPTFTGDPKGPTPAVDDNDTSLATTAYVIAQASAAGDGTPAMDGSAARGTAIHWARADHVHPTDTSRAPLAAPTFTGDAKAVTPAVDDNDTSIATTAYVIGQASASGDGTPAMDGVAARGTSIHWTRTDHVHPTDTSRAGISGTPSANQFATWNSATAVQGVAITGLVKGNGASAPAAATAGTDYLAPPSGTAILKAASGGALANAVAGTDYCAATSGSGVLKGSSGNTATATAGTDFMKPDTTSVISAGFTLTPNSIGNFPAPYTPNPALGNYQYGTNNGAFTWNAPASDCAMDVLVTNSASAGAITFSGYTVGSNTGEALTTTNTSKFIVSIRRINAVATYTIKALQ